MTDSPVAEPDVDRPLTGGAVMGAVSRVSVAVTGALTTIAVARLLGPSGTGGFAIALTIGYVQLVLTTLGIEHGIAYYVTSGAWAARDALATATRLAVAVGTAAATVTILLRLVFPGPFGGLSVAASVCAAIALPFTLLWFYASFVALADNHYEGYVVPPALQSATALVVVVALCVPFGLDGAVLGLLVSQVLAGVVTVVWSRRRLSGRPSGVTPPRDALRRALNFGIKGYLANALQSLNYRVDVFILAALAPAAEVGTYSVALGATAALWLLPQALSDVLFPRVAALNTSSRENAAEHEAFVIGKSVRHTTVIVIAGALLLALALWALVVPVYGADFEPAIELSMILIPGVCLIGIGSVLSAVIVGRGKPEYSLYGALFSTPLTLILYATLIPPYEATGAAAATSISFTLNFIAASFFFRRVTGQRVLPMLVPTLDEWHDYRMLWPKILEWARTRRGVAGA